MESLQASRFEIPLALVHDRFILAIGGKTSKNYATTRLEAYDIVMNHWFMIESLPETVTGTSAVVMNDQEVYLMPGNNRNGTFPTLAVYRLDTGPVSQFPRDTSNKSYGYCMSQHRWTMLEINNSEFVRSCPTAALSLGPSTMLIFGGNTTKCFLLDTVNNKDKKATVEMTATQLTTEAHFGIISVHYLTSMGTNYYAIDSNRKFLYHLSTSNLAWKCKSLRELGIDTMA